LSIFVYSIRLNAFHLIVLESLPRHARRCLQHTMKFDYAKTRAVIRIRPLDIKGLVDETYELLRSGY